MCEHLNKKYQGDNHIKRSDGAVDTISHFTCPDCDELVMIKDYKFPTHDLP